MTKLKPDTKTILSMEWRFRTVLGKDQFVHERFSQNATAFLGLGTHGLDIVLTQNELNSCIDNVGDQHIEIRGFDGFVHGSIQQMEQELDTGITLSSNHITYW